MLADKHHDEVDDPKNESQTDQTNDTCKDFAVHEAGDRAADPRSEGDDCENHADNIGKTEVIAFCHGFYSF